MIAEIVVDALVMVVNLHNVVWSSYRTLCNKPVCSLVGKKSPNVPGLAIQIIYDAVAIVLVDALHNISLSKYFYLLIYSLL